MNGHKGEKRRMKGRKVQMNGRTYGFKSEEMGGGRGWSIWREHLFFSFRLIFWYVLSSK